MRDIAQLGLAWNLPGVDPMSPSFRPPSWPPPADWPVSQNADGTARSRFSDEIWDFTPWVRRRFVLNMTGGQKGSRARRINASNAHQLRLVMTWLIWGPHAAASPMSLMYQFNSLRPLFSIATDNEVCVSEFMRFPGILELFPKYFTAKTFESTPLLLHRLWDHRAELGFILLDPPAIRRLVEIMPTRARDQTPYIPSRIWTHQVKRLRECIDDFLENVEAIQRCFEHCLDQYSEAAGSLEAAVTCTWGKSSKRPFRKTSSEKGLSLDSNPRLFVHVANRFGIHELIDRWVGNRRTRHEHAGVGVGSFSQYLSLVQYACFAYILNFTVQRKEEASSLRADCLVWDDDPLGPVPIICGETTKTDPDSDARWPTSPTVRFAVEAAGTIAKLRVRCAAAHPVVRPSLEDISNPFLFHRVFEPFGAATDPGVEYSTLPALFSYGTVLSKYPRLFDLEKLRITEGDLAIARMFAPHLAGDPRYGVGEIWPLAWHQLRRTGAVNMFASDVLSDGSVQTLMKHSSRTMTRYYGRGHSHLRMNEIASTAVISTMYEVRDRQVAGFSEDRYVSPIGDDRKRDIIANLVNVKDAKRLGTAGEGGKVTFRAVRLGACTKQGACEYGGIESVARCGGGDGTRPCADLLFDRTKRSTITDELFDLNKAIESASPGTVRMKALQAERRALENFLDGTRR